jgi:NADH:ubiquinone oxidoreductase subunit 4 (subunit M)
MSSALRSRLAGVLVALAAIPMWWPADHRWFSGGLLLVLGVPALRAWRRGANGRELLVLLLTLATAVAHAWLPFSAPIAVLTIAIVGGAFPLQLWLETLRRRLPASELTVLLLTQPGLAVAVHVLGPQTVTLEHTTRGWLAAWFVVAAVVQTGLGLVRRDPLRAIVAIGLSQSVLLIAGAMASGRTFAAEYSMLLGTDLGLVSLLLVLAELRSRYGVVALSPGHGLAEVEGRLARLFLVAGWLFVGLPGGIVFFAEDLLFHALMAHSTWTAAGMIFASVLNGIVFYRVHLGLFSGRMDSGLRANSRRRRWLPPLLRVLVVVTLWFGMFPQHLLLGAH